MGATHQNALAAARPVPGTPLWARPDHPSGAPRPASPWDAWTIPPKRQALNTVRKPRPYSDEPFRPWRIDFAQADVIEYPNHPIDFAHADVEHPDHPIERRPDRAPVAKRLLLLVGLAYLFLAALATGLVWTAYAENPTASPEPNERPEKEAEPSSQTRPARSPEPERHPNDPGLHVCPDGSRYLIVPLPSNVAERFGGRTLAGDAA